MRMLVYLCRRSLIDARLPRGALAGSLTGGVREAQAGFQSVGGRLTGTCLRGISNPCMGSLKNWRSASRLSLVAGQVSAS